MIWVKGSWIPDLDLDSVKAPTWCRGGLVAALGPAPAPAPATSSSSLRLAHVEAAHTTQAHLADCLELNGGRGGAAWAGTGGAGVSDLMWYQEGQV